ncbi:MAG: DUF2785 domain-containing protein [Planctomycetes bacterium]|nr:DUF2785 domain-containing protein [Planctomycetota bacterium]
MPTLRRSATVCLLALVVVGASAPAQSHDAEFWRGCLARDAAPPAAAELPGLLAELTGMLDSPDPEVRDDLAFSVLARWLVRDGCVPVEERRKLLATWTANLRRGLDGSGGEDAVAVVGRSFAALALSLLAATDAKAAWLSTDEHAALLTAALGYLRDERDVRGFDDKLGWVHSVAHTADLLKFLLRSERTTAAQQKEALEAIAAKLAAVATPLVHGEDERLARAVVSLVARADCDAAGLRAFLFRAWPAPQPAAPDAAALARSHNQRHFVLSLQALLLVERRELPALPAARDAVAAVVAARMRG